MTENENGTNPSETPTATNSTSVGNEPAAPVDPMVALQEQITALKQERDKLKDQLLRALAEQDNVRKRVQGSADERVRKAREEVIKELLPVFDNLERATQYMGTAVDVSAVAKGVEMVLRLFEDTLGKIGGKRIKSVGQPFDPSHHEAIQQVESAEHPAGTIVTEVQTGYLFGDRLLRPAMVVVSRGTAATSDSSGDGASDPPSA